MSNPLNSQGKCSTILPSWNVRGKHPRNDIHYTYVKLKRVIEIVIPWPKLTMLLKNVPRIIANRNVLEEHSLSKFMECVLRILSNRNVLKEHSMSKFIYYL